MQEGPIPPGTKLTIPKLPQLVPPSGDKNAIEEAARLLVDAENPLLVADSLGRTQVAVDHLVELADVLQCGVLDSYSRMNFPTRHPLNQTYRGTRATVGQADVILGLEVVDFWGVTHSFSDQIIHSTRIADEAGHQDHQHQLGRSLHQIEFPGFPALQEVDLAIAADGATTLPSSDRSGETARSTASNKSEVRRARRQAWRGAQGGADTGAPGSDLWLGRKPR